jgi:hypothetical protein
MNTNTEHWCISPSLYQRHFVHHKSHRHPWDWTCISAIRIHWPTNWSMPWPILKAYLLPLHIGNTVFLSSKMCKVGLVKHQNTMTQVHTLSFMSWLTHMNNHEQKNTYIQILLLNNGPNFFNNFMAGHCICTNHSCKFWTESVGPSVTTTSASLSLNTQIRTIMYYT